MQLYIGCSGWSYSSWQGPFYPSSVTSSSFLHYYSKAFDYVEIDSTFYRIPNSFMVRKWARTTPENFRFTAKFPKVITHDKRLENVDRELDEFLQAIVPLNEKTLCLLIQLPPFLTITKGLELLQQLVPQLDKRFRYAVEVRHPSWFQDLTYNYFAKERISMVWSQLADIQTPPIVTTDFLYLRFIGDRTIDPKDFGTIQKDRIKEMEYWANEVKKVQQDEEKNLKLAIASANNHYAGFGPMTANIFRSMMGLPEAEWEEKKQPTLSDF
ncbi:MAG: DUF72 domain-containing protein [Nitrososphaerales archaeon]